VRGGQKGCIVSGFDEMTRKRKRGKWRVIGGKGFCKRVGEGPNHGGSGYAGIGREP